MLFSKMVNSLGVDALLAMGGGGGGGGGGAGGGGGGAAAAAGGGGGGAAKKEVVEEEEEEAPDFVPRLAKQICLPLGIMEHTRQTGIG